jgi:hypothetical protein
MFRPTSGSGRLTVSTRDSKRVSNIEGRSSGKGNLSVLSDISISPTKFSKTATVMRSHHISNPSMFRRLNERRTRCIGREKGARA